MLFILVLSVSLLSVSETPCGEEDESSENRALPAKTEELSDLLTFYTEYQEITLLVTYIILHLSYIQGG